MLSDVAMVTHCKKKRMFLVAVNVSVKLRRQYNFFSLIYVHLSIKILGQKMFFKFSKHELTTVTKDVTTTI